MKLVRYLRNDSDDESCLETSLLRRGLEVVISIPAGLVGVVAGAREVIAFGSRTSSTTPIHSEMIRTLGNK